MNDVVLGKIQIVQRCVQRAREELAAAGADFPSDYSRQDADLAVVESVIREGLDDLLRGLRRAVT